MLDNTQKYLIFDKLQRITHRLCTATGGHYWRPWRHSISIYTTSCVRCGCTCVAGARDQLGPDPEVIELYGPDFIAAATPNSLSVVTDMHGRIYDWDDAGDKWARRG